MSDPIDRRRFLAAAAMTVAATELTLSPSAARANDAQNASVKAGGHTSFASLKQIDAGLLNVGYAEAGPADGKPVILLHGWPYDIYSFVDVAPMLASAGYRVIVPYLRGYGTTTFLSDATFRNGQPSALAVDIIALMDALKIDKATLAGFDWGARTADIVAALWPERCKALVSVSGYLIGSQEAGKMPLPPKAELQWWYQFYFATERGREGYDKYRRDFSKLIWQLASPKWNFDDATFERSAKAFDNPDHVAIVIHNYRWRLGLAKGEAKYDELEKQARRSAGHHRADHHHGRRRQRRAASGACRLREEVLGQVCAPEHQWRHRTQSAAGSPAGLCRRGDRRDEGQLIRWRVRQAFENRPHRPGMRGSENYFPSCTKRNSPFTRSGTTTISPLPFGKAQKSAGPLKSEASFFTPMVLFHWNSEPVTQSVAKTSPSLIT